ncbi:MAG: radical SAM protein [Candidatus Thiodiazotropha sp. (ex Epidulcina cf. delphinae)]|nr:radical SAM protein [Candidatus Thiodiazotropha sp. (ex Epidulcina cf. delphinae)]
MISAKWDLTSTCNLRCRHCSVANMYFDKENPVKELSIRDRLLVVDRLADGGVTHLSLLGGEPLTLGDDLWTLLDHAKRRQIRIHLVTNAILLEAATSQRLIDCGLDRLVVSIDGPTAESHNKIRGKRTFERLNRNLETFLDLRGSNDTSKLTINTVLCTHNRKNFADMIPFCRNLGADAWNALTLNYIGNAYNHLDSLAVSQEEHTEVALEIGRLLKSQGFDAGQLKINLTLICPLVWEYLCKKYKIELPQPEICCSAGSSLAYISPKGDMHLCDRVDSSGYNGMPLATEKMHPESLLSKEFEAIWNSKQYVKMYDFVQGNEAYTKFEPCNHCKYLFDRTCNPCPLQSYRLKDVRFEECLKAEKYLGDISRYEDGPTTIWEKAHQFERLSLAEPDSDKYERFRNAYPILARGVRSAIQGGDCILLHPKSLQTIKLNDVGHKILKSMDGSLTTGQLIDTMIDLYQQAYLRADMVIDEGQVDAFRVHGLQAFVMSLYERDFIEMNGQQARERSNYRTSND